MTKKRIIIIAIAAILLIIACILIPLIIYNSNKCEHTYDNACDATCNECGETREVGAHHYSDATCTVAKTCKICGITEGTALGHTWTAATCESARTCSVCGHSDGEALGHTPAADDGNCSTALCCSVCNAVIREAGTHLPEKDDGNCTTDVKCSVCGEITANGNENHADENGDYVCDNDGCQITLEGAPKDENEGIDLPIDRN